MRIEPVADNAYSTGVAVVTERIVTEAVSCGVERVVAQSPRRSTRTLHDGMMTMRTIALALGWSCFVWGAMAAPEAIWDLDWAKTAPLEVEVASEAVETHADVDVVHRELIYTSHTWNAANIRIAGHLVYPKSAEENPLPAMTLVTASESDARNMALTANVVALAIDRVGEGGSTGPADDYKNWLDIDEGTDIRNSWMYHYFTTP